MEAEAFLKLVDATLPLAPNLRQQLEERINWMIHHQFEQLVQLLYRIDVSEQKLKSALQKQPTTDSAKIIAGLLIERQQQKLRVRKNFNSRTDAPSPEESW